MNPARLIREVASADVRARAIEHLRAHDVVLPTFRQLAEPWTAPVALRESLARVDTDAADPANLFRINWYNDGRGGQADVPLHVVLPKSLTGVDAPVIVLLGYAFPMIGAHKVLPAYACLAPRLAAGLFDPMAHRAVWPSTGNYCRGGVAVSRILGCRGVAVLPEGMSRERFDWLEAWVSSPSDIVRTAGTESNVKEIYDKCAELERDPANVIVNQFSEFANYACHWRCTGPALERAFAAVANGSTIKLAGFVAASGSSGTLAAGDYLKERHGTTVAVVEALECPTLSNNGYGEHNIQGIGDKHVPLIHNVMNTDFVIAVTDKATDGLNAVFNTKAGRACLRAQGIPGDIIDALPKFGLSSIANVLGAIKLAKDQRLGANDAIVTVATDPAVMYHSELEAWVGAHYGGKFDATDAAAIFARFVETAGPDNVLECTPRERERIFNLGYFTWVEQRGVPLEEFESRRRPAFWRDVQGLVDTWDDMIEACNSECDDSTRYA